VNCGFFTQNEGGTKGIHGFKVTHKTSGPHEWDELFETIEDEKMFTIPWNLMSKRRK